MTSTDNRKNKSCRIRLSRMAIRPRLLAAMIRTSTWRLSSEPTGRTSPSCRTRNSFAWTSSGSSPISSSNRCRRARLRKRPVIGDRAGENAPFVTEQLALDEIARERRAIEDDERRAGPWTVGMNEVRDDLLAGARLAGNQNRGVAVGRRRRPLEHRPHPFRSADHTLEPVVRRGQAAEAVHAVTQLGGVENARDRLAQQFFGERNRNEIVCAAPDRLGCMIDGRVGADDEDCSLGPLLFDRFEDIERRRVGTQIADYDEAQRGLRLDGRQHRRHAVGGHGRPLRGQQLSQRRIQLAILRGDEDPGVGVGNGHSWCVGGSYRPQMLHSVNKPLRRESILSAR